MQMNQQFLYSNQKLWFWSWNFQLSRWTSLACNQKLWFWNHKVWLWSWRFWHKTRNSLWNEKSCLWNNKFVFQNWNHCSGRGNNCFETRMSLSQTRNDFSRTRNSGFDAGIYSSEAGQVWIEFRNSNFEAWTSSSARKHAPNHTQHTHNKPGRMNDKPSVDAPDVWQAAFTAKQGRIRKAAPRFSKRNTEGLRSLKHNDFVEGIRQFWRGSHLRPRRNPFWNSFGLHWTSVKISTDHNFHILEALARLQKPIGL